MLLALTLVLGLVLGLVSVSTSHATDAAERTRTPRPEVYKVRPNSGSTDGGTVIMLRGKYFTKTRKVFFDRTPAASFKVVSDKKLRVVSPPHVEGLYRIWVVTKHGRAKPGGFDGFRFVDDGAEPPPPPLAPTVSALSPKQGTIFGGTTVTITGTNFDATSQVMFGTTAAASVKVNSPTSITVQAPPHSLGTVDVRVTTLIGTSANVTQDDYTYTLFG
jgi:hypothetical protein